MNTTISTSFALFALAAGSTAQHPGRNPGTSPRAPTDVSIQGLDDRALPAAGGSTGLLASPSTGVLATLDCVGSLADQATSGCLHASSTPVSGRLFPYPGKNNAFAAPAFVGGGENNAAGGRWSAIGGGLRNTADGDGSTIGGGGSNAADGTRSTIGGGVANVAGGDDSTIGGGGDNATGDDGATVGGGSFNIAGGTWSTIGGGRNNLTSDDGAAVGGGYFNTGAGAKAAVGGGFGNTASGGHSTVGGGGFNGASGGSSTVGGGNLNTASGQASTVGGGSSNTAAGDSASVPGGALNAALGRYSLAAGRRAKANHRGAFVWGDGEGGIDKPSSTEDEFTVYCRGGARFFSDGAAATAGVTLAPGAGSWSSVSDRASKENVEPVAGRAVLERLAGLPVATWNYKAQEDSIRHMGPMAQDFREAFGLGASERSIDTIDADGVALAAIQGLHELVRANERQLAQKEEEIEALRARLERLETLVRGAPADLAPSPSPLGGSLGGVSLPENRTSLPRLAW